MWGPERVLKIALAFFCLFFIFSACYCHFFAFCCVFFSLYKIVLECKQIVLFPSRQSPLSTHHLYNVGSLRSKRFQSSYCANKLERERKTKRLKREGEGRRGKEEVPSFPSPSPVIPFFLLSSRRSRRTRAETLATQATALVVFHMAHHVTAFDQ